MTYDLHDAASAGDTAMLDVLLDRGADINGYEVEGLTPLHCAVCGGHRDVVALLLDRGANPDLAVQESFPRHWTALHFCAENDEPECAKLLLDAGADPNIADEAGVTPLLQAFDEMIRPEVAMLLIQYAADTTGALEKASRYARMQGAQEVIHVLQNSVATDS